MIIWVNGGLLDGPASAAISPADHGLTVGDGVFETMKIVDGEAFAYLKEQTDDVMRQARDASRVAVRSGKWGRSCGDGAIDSAEESDAVYDCGRQAIGRASCRERVWIPV